MLTSRLLVTLVLLPVGLALIIWGGLPYAFLIALVLALAGGEYARLFRVGGYQPAGVLIVAGILLLMFGRVWNGFQSAPWLSSLVILLAMTYHLLAYERGRDQAATDFGITLGGIFYIGWLGSYLISVRDLPEGKWWLLLVLPTVWIADSGAYFIGRWLGKHKLSPRLSPKKTWEGYLAGVVFGALGGILLATAWRVGAGSETEITLLRGAIIGTSLSVITPLGDLGESMIKRQVGVKDSSHLLPGHGGMFDRIDSWLWAVVIGYYIIVGLFI